MRPGENDHPEQDPAEGSREVIDKDLAQQDDGNDGKPGNGSGAKQAPDQKPKR